MRYRLGFATALVAAWVLGAPAAADAQLEMYAFDGANSGDFVGISARAAGDVDGDGVADVIGGGHGAETVWVWSGATGAVLHAFSDDIEPASAFGWGLSGAGDVNNDTFDDLILASSWHSSGYARVYSGADGLLLYEIDDADAFSVSDAGDLNSDGFDDFMVGGTIFFVPDGIARVYSGFDGSVLYTFEGDAFGWSVANAGDVDNDGVTDLIVGDARDSTNGTDAGAARVYSGADGSLIHELFGQPTARFGSGVDGVGDLDGDGFGEVIVGAYQDYDVGPAIGSARVFSGADGSELFGFMGDAEGSYHGLSVSAGDVDRDGIPDLLVGAAVRNPDGEQSEGAVFAYSGVDGSLIYIVQGEPDGAAGFGWALDAVGDLDGDGATDLVVGANSDSRNVLWGGSVRILSGRPVLFADDFDEGGEDPAWSAVRDPLDHLSGAAAGLAGTDHALAVTIDHDPPAVSDAQHFVLDQTPSGARGYETRFWFDPNGIDLATKVKIHATRGDDGARLTRLLLRRNPAGSSYLLRYSALNDNGKWVNLAWVALADEPALVGMTWRQGDGSGNGAYSLLLNDVVVASRTGFNNDDRSLGAQAIGNLGLFRPGTHGTLLFDEFVAYDDPSGP